MTPEANPFLDIEGQVRLTGESLTNCSGFMVAAIVGIAVVPVMLAGLGAELYGLWVVTVALSGWAAAVLDLGLSWSVIREVAAGDRGSKSDEVARFVAAAGNLYLALAIVGALLICVLGLPMSRVLALSPEGRSIAPLVFVLVAAGFVASQMLTYQLAVLQGLRRFDLSNLLLVSSALLTAIGIVAALTFRSGILGVTGVQSVSVAVSAFAGYLTVSRVEPGFRQRLGQFDWASIRSRMRFSLGSQLLATLNAIFWDAAPLLVAPILGPGVVAQYQVGRKFPQAVARLAASAGLVVLPAASGYQKRDDPARARRALEAGTRWLAVFSLPLCIVLWILAPSILRVWVGGAAPETVSILRLVTATALLEAICTGPFNVLWGRGAVGILLAVMGFLTIGNLALTVWLLGRIGIVGAAWALLIPLAFATVAVLFAASRRCGTTVLKLAQRVTSGLGLPIVVCAATTLLVGRFASSAGWFGLISTALAGGLAYVTSLYLHGAREEEKTFVRQTLRGLLMLAPRMFQAVRSLARLAGLSRQQYPRIGAVAVALERLACAPVGLADALFGLACDPYRAGYSFDRLYAPQADPWGYAVVPFERERHRLAAELLDAACNGRPFRRALEIGCSEGMFTEALAERCESLVAVDFSRVSLERARKRRKWGDSVRFQEWDLRRDPIPGQFDLIVVMDVFMYVRRPERLRMVFEKLVAGMRPGDLMLAGNPYEEDFFRAQWGRFLLRGKWAIEALQAHPALETMRRAGTDTHVFALLRKLPASRSCRLQTAPAVAPPSSRP